MNRIPQQLKDHAQWIVWKSIERDGKETKVPFQPNGQPAKSNDPETWSSFTYALDAAPRFSGLGFVFSADDPFCGIDLDGCRNPETGEIAKWARHIIRELNTYTEVSPSKTGVKLFCRAKWPAATGSKKELPNEPKLSDKTPAIEAYDHGRYFAVTGWALDGYPNECEDRQDVVDRIFRYYFPEPKIEKPTTDWDSPTAVMERAAKYVATMDAAISGSNGHKAAFKVACVLVLGFGLSESEARPIFDEYNRRCEPPWNDREIKHKLASAAKQSGPRGFLRDQPVHRWKHVEVPEYREPEQLPAVVTLQECANEYIDMLRRGEIKLLSCGISEVDYALGGGIEFSEFIVAASRPSHGKSAFGLQVCDYANHEGIPALFVSEEMGRLPIGKRTIQYVCETHQDNWERNPDALESEVERAFAKRGAKTFVSERTGTVDRCAETIRRYAKEEGVRFVVVDYAQLLDASGKTRHEQISTVSRTLRRVANEEQIVLIALCQLNRAIEQRPRFVPQLSDLRDSGQLEQDADVLLFFVWPHRIDSSQDPGMYKIYIQKNRNRAINQTLVVCEFRASRQMIVEKRIDPATDWPDPDTRVGGYQAAKPSDEGFPF